MLARFAWPSICQPRRASKAEQSAITRHSDGIAAQVTWYPGEKPMRMCDRAADHMELASNEGENCDDTFIY